MSSCELSFDAGARSLFYGSALGLGGVVLIGALALRVMDVRSPADLRDRMQRAVQPLGDSVRQSMSPIKERMQVRFPSKSGSAPSDWRWVSREILASECCIPDFDW